MISLDLVLSLLIKYKYAILFPGLVIEGPVLTIMSGFLASPAGGSIFSLYTLYILVVLSDVVGDTIYYLIGRWGRRSFIKALIIKWRGNDQALETLEKYFDNYGGRTLLAAKVTHGIGWPVLIAAGSARMPYRRFIATNTIISIFKSALLIALGYFYGQSYVALSRYINYGGLIMTFIVAVITLLIWRGFPSKFGR